jgi:hypothetical protein
LFVQREAAGEQLAGSRATARPRRF